MRRCEFVVQFGHSHIFGAFDPDKATVIEARSIEGKAALEAGIRALRGNLGYYAGFDRKNNNFERQYLGEH
jgi:hypothetical protein